MGILKEVKSEKILMSVALFMFALIIGYNAFFAPQIPNTPKVSGNIVLNKSSQKETDTSKSKTAKIININTASQEELSENVPGVGPAVAKQIIVYRETHGGFSIPEEIMNVKGISKKIFQKLKNNIKVK